jgi:hypothetical protein
MQLKKIRGDLAAMTKSMFAKVLGDGGCQLVTEPGHGVLDVPNIINLYVNAPESLWFVAVRLPWNVAPDLAPQHTPAA